MPFINTEDGFAANSETKIRQSKRDKKSPKGFCFDLGYLRCGGWEKPH